MSRRRYEQAFRASLGGSLVQLLRIVSRQVRGRCVQNRNRTIEQNKYCMCESTGLLELDQYQVYSSVNLRGKRVETELGQYQIRYRVSMFCRGSKEGVLGTLLVRIGNRTVILQYNQQLVKCQVIQEDTVTKRHIQRIQS